MMEKSSLKDKEHSNDVIKEPTVKTINEYKDEGPRLSRAEYILQAREACLRQMNKSNKTSRIYELYGADEKPGKAL